MSPDTPFDRRLRRLRRDRAAGTAGDGGYLLHLAADELLERLSWVKRDFAEALNIGAADDYLRRGLERRVASVICCDPGRLFARQATVQCDEDRLPFADGSFD
ncbi:MAG TPA: SAM-dependent methyltransferase, partial [Allosphingosinicella sp.]|nr:SAM-dependent methyltransferase [Allosphingosinicella sp.]